jgi:glycosyltransferase involved in cell wall biosynthesis
VGRPLRFCMITTFYPPYNFGGDGVFVERLSGELARRGHHVEVIHCTDAYRLAARAPLEPAREQPGVTVHALGSRLGRLSPLLTHQTGSPMLKSRTIRGILDRGFDVIHHHNISLVGGPGLLALGDAVKLYTLHDYWLVCPTHALFRHNKAPCAGPPGCLACTLVHKRPPQLWRQSRKLSRALRHVDAFIAPSLTAQRKHEQLGIARQMVHIPNFAAPEGGAEAPARDASAAPYFLFVGRLERLKGLEGVIPAFTGAGLAELWIAGAGSEESRLRDLARGNERVRFLGQRSGQELEALYRDAVALVYPAVNFQIGVPSAEVRNGHGAPLVIIEAFAQRTPVVASRAGRIPALLDQTGGGVSYGSEAELRLTLDRLLKDAQYRDALGAHGNEAYRRTWTAAAHLERYFELIDEISTRRAAEYA